MRQERVVLIKVFRIRLDDIMTSAGTSHYSPSFSRKNDILTWMSLNSLLQWVQIGAWMDFRMKVGIERYNNKALFKDKSGEENFKHFQPSPARNLRKKSVAKFITSTISYVSMDRYFLQVVN